MTNSRSGPTARAREAAISYVYAGKGSLITGASSGIGEAIARALAARGGHLVLVARRAGKLRLLAQELAAQHHVDVEVVPMDLSVEGAAERLYEAVEQRRVRVDLLVNNAGFGTYGRFHSLSPSLEHAEAMLNAVAVLDLTHCFLPAMLARNDGAVINIASVASFMPFPYQSVYGATKAFVLAFSAGLSAEYRGRNIRVVAVCPGATRTNFFAVMGDPRLLLRTRPNVVRGPDQVAATALRALEKNRPISIDGAPNAGVVCALKLLPPMVIARLVEKFMRPAACE